MANFSPARAPRRLGGFTLIEMIGVLAIIALLAAMVLPKVAGAISDAKVSNAVAGYQSVQAATTAHYGKYLAYNSYFGTNVYNVGTTQMNNYDLGFLIPEGFLDHAFVPKVGMGAVVEVVNAAAANGGTGYAFDSIATGGSTTNGCSTSTFQFVIQCVLTNVSPADAYAISLAVDGATLTPQQGLPDNMGKITYDGTSLLHMYVDGR